MGRPPDLQIRITVLLEFGLRYLPYLQPRTGGLERERGLVDWAVARAVVWAVVCAVAVAVAY